MVFDLGGVILAPTTALPRLAELIRAPHTVTPEQFAAAYYERRRWYDETSDGRGYWSAVAAACGAPPPDPAEIDALTEADTAGWLGIDPATIALAGDLREAGTRLAVLSNAPASMGRAVRRQPWSSMFTTVVISGEIGVVKPDPAIYRALLEKLAVPAERVWFTDDRPENVSGALAAGIHAVRFTDAAALRSALARGGLLG